MPLGVERRQRASAAICNGAHFAPASAVESRDSPHCPALALRKRRSRRDDPELHHFRAVRVAHPGDLLKAVRGLLLAAHARRACEAYHAVDLALLARALLLLGRAAAHSGQTARPSPPSQKIGSLCASMYVPTTDHGEKKTDK